jgi:hypothetical protein
MNAAVASARGMTPSMVPSLSGLPPADELPPMPPPPEALAPWLFFPPNRGASTSGNGVINGAQPSAAAPPTNMGPPPEVPSSLPTPPVSSPPPLPDAAAKNLEGKNKDAPPKDEGIPKVTSDVPVHGFDDQMIRMLNARLEDPDWQKRADAAMDFFLVLQANPGLNKRPDYKAYVDAFALKILNDPIAVVHEPILLAIETGLYKHPSPEVMDDLAELKASSGLLGLEPQMIEDSLRDLSDDEAKEWQESQKKEQRLASQSDALPPALAGTVMDSPITLPAAASLPPSSVSSAIETSMPSSPAQTGDLPPMPARAQNATPSSASSPLPDLSTPYIAASQGLHGPRGQTFTLPKWRLPWQSSPKSNPLETASPLPTIARMPQLAVSPSSQPAASTALPGVANPVGGQLNVVSS